MSKERIAGKEPSIKKQKSDEIDAEDEREFLQRIGTQRVRNKLKRYQKKGLI